MGLTVGVNLVLVATGLTLVFGMMGVINFAHSALFMLGAYVGLVATTRLGSFWVGLRHLLVFSSVPKLESPVTLPPGRARLATRPAATGSPALTITIGMVVVARLASNAPGVDVATNRSILSRTKSAASWGRRSFFCSANRYSMAIFFPTIHPSLPSSCRNASMRTALPEAVLLSRTPMWKIFPVCCASASEIFARKRVASSQRVILFFMLLFLAS